MTKSTIYYGMASIDFIISFIMFLIAYFCNGGIFGGIGIGLLIAGWILWVIGLICRLRGN